MRKEKENTHNDPLGQHPSQRKPRVTLSKMRNGTSRVMFEHTGEFEDDAPGIPQSTMGKF